MIKRKVQRVDETLSDEEEGGGRGGRGMEGGNLPNLHGRPQAFTPDADEPPSVIAFLMVTTSPLPPSSPH